MDCIRQPPTNDPLGVLLLAHGWGGLVVQGRIEETAPESTMGMRVGLDNNSEASMVKIRPTTRASGNQGTGTE